MNRDNQYCNRNNRCGGCRRSCDNDDDVIQLAQLERQARKDLLV